MLTTLKTYQQTMTRRLRAMRSGTVIDAARQPEPATVDRVRKLANDAIQQYSDEVFAGGEPVFPDWARDVLELCDQHDAMAAKLQRRS
ncbi:hypothetical protein [Bordetella phage vB_BbrM_PHB04]|uniref:Uncharacterized protein n=1 Tax=Bordetella phage vB_BbrM_PHB04 TaxID=2029657 RepID=A0A291LAQ9_9CAUD|nr:hypothetical protein HOS14_gp088 [Bordetella phage vB_BbrM_PHB04]ATI15706.1 hypothetical protein [Bordetella phage vB_BbrM_PHB04]